MRTLLQDAGLALAVDVDSAGTHARAGEPPAAAAIEVMAARGIDIRDLRARQFLLEDFERFDLILAMDRSNLGHLRYLCPPDFARKVKPFMTYARNSVLEEVADPYGRWRQAFEQALQSIDDACAGLLAAARSPLPWG